ncbi:hypothetical protein THII_2919 [Thioploca ingrica]|uniref:Secreted protein n=1 Tax=Thioploca ingrica TaxID=40754 RepID=A0A090BVP5_9GAMM|nr:hypothetical protein THII_2919 [Thioploca ingrica]
MTRVIAIIWMLSTTSLTLASTLPDFPFVSAHGQAEIELPPNMAEVTFYLKAFHENPNNAITVIQQRSKELLSFFVEQQVKEEDIVAYELDKNIVHERDKDFQQLKILGYEVTRRFNIKLHNLKQYEIFAKKLFSLENVENINTVFERTDEETIKADLLIKAGKDAMQQAERAAKGFDVSVGPVFAISEQGFSDLGTQFGLGRDDYYSSISTGSRGTPSPRDEDEFLFVPSTITFMNRVSALFKLQAKNKD